MNNFIKKFLNSFALMIMFCSQSLAACPNGYTRDSSGLCVKASACGGNCTYYYNDTTYDFEAKVNPNVAPGTPVLMEKILGEYEGKNLHNVKIGEGITGFATDYVFFNNNVGENGRGTLTMPSTFDDTYIYKGIFNSKFAAYDLSAMKDAHLQIGSSLNYDIIISSDANLEIKRYCIYGNCPSSVNIQCKGKKDECTKQMKGKWGEDPNNNWSATNITKSYYNGLDKDGNWEVWSDEGKAVYADSSMQKLLSKYDFDGNQTGFYKYDAGGNLIAVYENGVATYRRRIYTPSEATAAASGNKNTFSITYR